MTPEQLLAQVEFFGSAEAVRAVAAAARDQEAAAIADAEAADALEKIKTAVAELEQLRYERRILAYARMILDRTAEYENLSAVDKPILRREAADCAQRIVDEIGHSVTDEPALGPELREEVARLTAELAEVRTGKSRVGDGIDRRGWTDEQWLEEARSIFNDAFGGAGDLLNGHISAMWKQITSAKKEQEQLAAIVAATLRQLGAVLGVNIGEEIRKARPEQSPGWPPPSGSERQLTIDTTHMREPIAGHCIRCREDNCDGCFYCQEQKRAK